ncbi:MAG: hypothetical protein AB7O49_11670 [Sphingomonadales bacterium]
MSAVELSNAVAVEDAGSGTWYYAPKEPGIARDGNGRPQFNLLSAGPVSFLQITGTWGLGAADVDGARRELAGKLGRDPTSLDFRPMPERVDGVSLMLGDGADGYTVLQQGKSSGMPPHHAAFNVMLDERQLKTVREALDGKQHQLVLRYDITRQTPVTSATAEHVATSEADEGCGPDGSWSSASGHAETSASRETVMQTEKLGVQLDAADWPSAR